MHFGIEIIAKVFWAKLIWFGYVVAHPCGRAV
jgi:hypothetical protein